VANITAVIFDYYETLGQLSPPTRTGVFDDLARRVGLDLPPGEAYRHWRELTTKDWKLRLGGHERPPLAGSTPPFVTFREVWLERSRQLLQQWKVDEPAQVGLDAYRGIHSGAAVYPDVPPALEELRGRYRLAVLSDADNDFLAASVARNDLSFETVVSSEDLQMYKPHVSVFREVCARLGVKPSEAVYVGDSPWSDVEGARHAGMGPVWINRHGAAWPHEIEAPPATISSLAELVELLDSVA
jgi:2-haloalkanoic acid dehalogenase type II